LGRWGTGKKKKKENTQQYKKTKSAQCVQKKKRGKKGVEKGPRMTEHSRGEWCLDNGRVEKMGLQRDTNTSEGWFANSDEGRAVRGG